MTNLSPEKAAEIRGMVHRAVAETKITDLHTHLYSPAFGPLLLWGIDEVITYHYLIAETFRWIDMPYADYWKLSKREQADLIWKTLFVEHSPISESCRGVLTALHGLGLDVASRDLDSFRAYFEKQDINEHIDTVFDAAGLDSVVMTNDPFDDTERPVWESKTEMHPRFHTALRIDVLLNNWDFASGKLAEWGYKVNKSLDSETISEVRRFLKTWVERMKALYMAVSLPDDFAFPEDSVRAKLIAECVLPVAREVNVPLALMIGVKRAINPALKLAGDSLGTADVSSVENLCATYPDNKFMVTMLARENQHQMAVVTRKFRNLMLFGCWWFLNNPSLIEEITRMRLELLGLSMIPQHSDARVLEQVIYKWTHSRKVIGAVLVDKYLDLAATGWTPTEEEIRRDVADIFGQNFWRFVKGS